MEFEEYVANVPTIYEAYAMQDMPGCAIVLGPKGQIVYANDAASEIMGIGSYVGQPFGHYFVDDATPANDSFYELLLEAVRNPGKRNQSRCPFTTPDDRQYVFFVTTSVVKSPDGEKHLVITCADVTVEERLEQMRRESTTVFISAIIYICSFIYIYAIWAFLDKPFPASYLTRVLEFGGIILGIRVYRHSSLTLQDLGLGTKNLKENLTFGALASLVIAGFFCIVKLITMKYYPQGIVHPEAFFQLGWVTPVRFVMYIFTAVIQEFLSRGIMQESLLHVIVSRHAAFTSIAVSTMMFVTLHVMYGPIFMAFAGLLLGAFGVIYMRQRSIWGLALIHFSFGMSAAMLGLI